MLYDPYTIEEVKKSAEQKLFTVISTFAGGGGASTGYKMAGGNILFVNEFVEAARETYLANYEDTPMIHGDIITLSGIHFLDKTNNIPFIKGRGLFYKTNIT